MQLIKTLAERVRGNNELDIQGRCLRKVLRLPQTPVLHSWQHRAVQVAAVELRLEEASAPGGQDLLEESVAAGEALKAAGRAGERTRNLLIRCRRMLAEARQWGCSCGMGCRV